MTILNWLESFEGKRIFIQVSSNNVVSLPSIKCGSELGRVISVTERRTLGQGCFLEMEISYQYEPKCKEEVARVRVELDSEIILYN